MFKKELKLKLLLLTVLMFGFAFFGVANASNSLIYLSPDSLDKKVGDSFSLSAIVNTAGSKVCAVEGDLVFDKLSCESIVLNEDVMAQKQPSCANPAFLIGLPGCTTVDKTLFTVITKGQQAGEASVNFKDVEIIGEGFPLSSTSVGGTYALSAVQTQPQTETETETSAPIIPEVVPAENCVYGEWSEWQRNDCGAGECEATQLSQTRTRTAEPDNCVVTVENRCIADAYCATMVPITKDGSSQTASILGAMSFSNYGWLGGLLILIILAIVFYFSRKRKK